jgi:hypothetical protein
MNHVKSNCAHILRIRFEYLNSNYLYEPCKAKLCTYIKKDKQISRTSLTISSKQCNTKFVMLTARQETEKSDCRKNKTKLSCSEVNFLDGFELQ